MSGCDFESDYRAFCADTGRCEASNGPDDSGSADDAGVAGDAGSTDGGDPADAGEPTDAGFDAGQPDGGAPADAGFDAGQADAGDGGAADAGKLDAGKPYLAVGSDAGRVFPTQCWPFTVKLLAENGTAYARAGAFPVSVDLAGASTGLADVTIHPLGNCTVLAPATVAFAGPQMDFSARSTAPGLAKMVATSSGFDAGALNKNVEATSLVITSPEQTVVPNPAGCSAPIVVELRDSYGSPVPFPAPTMVQLSADAGAFLYPNANCTAPASTQLPVPPGAPGAAFSFLPTQVGTFRVSADAGVLGAASQVTHAGQAFLTFDGLPWTLSPGACSLQSGSVTMRDAAGNTAALMVAENLSLTASPSGCAVFRETTSCPTWVNMVTVVPGATGAPLYLSAGGVPGRCRITATGSGLFNPAQVDVIIQ